MTNDEDLVKKYTESRDILVRSIEEYTTRIRQAENEISFINGCLFILTKEDTENAES